MMDSPGELHGWYLCVALVHLMINHYVALHSCNNHCQPCALPSVKKTTNTACQGLYTPFSCVTKGLEQRGPQHVQNLHTIASPGGGYHVDQH